MEHMDVDESIPLFIHDKCADKMGLPIGLLVQKVKEGEGRITLCVCSPSVADRISYV